MPHYFAYGSNMNPAQMAARCPGARPIGPGVLAGHQLIFPHTSRRWQNRGVASIRTDPRSFIEGVLYEMRDEDLLALDEFEGVSKGRYTRRTVRVRRGADLISCHTYVSLIGVRCVHRPDRAYVRAMLAGARRFGLSARYQARLGDLLVDEWADKSADYPSRVVRR